MISVCMIVRDEADCVGQALAGIADEICVVDKAPQNLQEMTRA